MLKFSFLYIMMKIKRYYLASVFIATVLLVNQPVQAQNSYNPNSAYGIGETNLGAQGYNAGMGGVSIGMRSKDFINTDNPAAISVLDSSVVLFNFSMNGKYSKFAATGNDQTAWNGNIRNLSLGLKIARFWGSAFCLAPYSSVGYDIYTLQPIEGSKYVESANYIGDGGINRIQWINAFKIHPKFSVGVNASYFFGSINTRQMVNSWTIKKVSSVQKVYFDFGLQFHDNISSDLNYTIGLIYGNKSQLSFKNTIYTTAGNTEIEDRTTKSTSQYLPQYFGGGVSFTMNEKISIAADYQYTQWSSLNKTIANVKYCDVSQIKAGIKVGPLKEITTNYLNRVHYMAGVAISNSYVERSGVNPKNFGVTAGFGLPIRQKAIVTISAELGKTGTTEKGMVSETYVRFGVGVSWKDVWFVRRKYD